MPTATRSCSSPGRAPAGSRLLLCLCGALAGLPSHASATRPQAAQARAARPPQPLRAVPARRPPRAPPDLPRAEATAPFARASTEAAASPSAALPPRLGGPPSGGGAGAAGAAGPSGPGPAAAGAPVALRQPPPESATPRGGAAGAVAGAAGPAAEAPAQRPPRLALWQHPDLESGQQPGPQPSAEAQELEVFGEFFLVYWGVVAVALGIWVYFTWAQSASQEWEHGGVHSVSFVDHGNRRELSQNMWNFFAVVALDKATMPGGRSVSCLAVGICNLLLGFLQMFTIFLLVIDIDPNADPVTEVPSSPWKRTTWSVNCMKWIQVALMAAAVSSEVSQAMQLFTLVMVVDAESFRVPKFFLILTAAGQYVVTLWVLFGGVAVVLSFQAVPDILYSSMAIVFVNSIDDLMYQFMESVFDIDADFQLPETPSSMFKHRWLHDWLPVMSRVVSVFPLVFALFLMGNSWYHNTMPNAWIREFIRHQHW